MSPPAPSPWSTDLSDLYNHANTLINGATDEVLPVECDRQITQVCFLNISPITTDRICVMFLPMLIISQKINKMHLSPFHPADWHLFATTTQDAMAQTNHHT